MSSRDSESTETRSPKQEIYTYECPWTCYALAWSNNKSEPYRLAVGSFIEEYSNKVQVRYAPLRETKSSMTYRVHDTRTQIVELDIERNELVNIAEFDHPYPTTKTMWHPSQDQCKGTIATTGDYLRLWKLTDSSEKALETTSATSSSTHEEGGEKKDHHLNVELQCVLNNSKNIEYCAPLTSMDWNCADPNIVGTSSIDTTCTIWDINKEKPTTQLIAHDKEVYDIGFQEGKHIFASVSADGSVRMFDLRNLAHSTIMYESDKQPLLRLRWNKKDTNYIAAMHMNDPKIVILDIRRPSKPVIVLPGHAGSCVNAISWAPHSSCHICTVGDDKQALIWDLTKGKDKEIDDPILAYNAKAEINNLTWSFTHQDWVAIAYEQSIQTLRV